MKWLFKACLFGFLGFIFGVIALYTYHMTKRPDLRIWHTVEFSAELTAEKIADLEDFTSYRQQENVLFEQLETRVYDSLGSLSVNELNRYRRDSWSDPSRFEVNWNRTFELKTASPKAAVLMLHGLTDSPYSMRSLAMSLNDRDAWVLGLRLPGHGTAPAGLADIRWQDFAAAVRLGARYLNEKIGDGVPLYLVGYSNGAALSLEYTLSQMLGEDLPKPAALVFISPAVTVSPMAFLASWKLRLAKLPGLEKLGWLSILPEYDPFKYNSFAVNAGEQIYQLTRKIRDQLNQLNGERGIQGFPPLLVFQSVADSTISPASIVDNFMTYLAPGSHDLVMFDINRASVDVSFLKNDSRQMLGQLYLSTLPFTFTLVTNEKTGSREVEIWQKRLGQDEKSITSMGMEWPRGVYSLSHVALPFSSEDPVYGGSAEGSDHVFTLGALLAKGEKGVLQIPASDLIRLRYNPFFTYLEKRTVDWIFTDRGAGKN